MQQNVPPAELFAVPQQFLGRRLRAVRPVSDDAAAAGHLVAFGVRASVNCLCQFFLVVDGRGWK